MRCFQFFVFVFQIRSISKRVRLKMLISFGSVWWTTKNNLKSHVAYITLTVWDIVKIINNENNVFRLLQSVKLKTLTFLTFLKQTGGFFFLSLSIFPIFFQSQIVLCQLFWNFLFLFVRVLTVTLAIVVIKLLHLLRA